MSQNKMIVRYDYSHSKETPMKHVAFITLAFSLFLTSCGHMKKSCCKDKESCDKKESCCKEKESCHKKSDQKKS